MEKSGFILDLTNERIQYQKLLNDHLKKKWLDSRTKTLEIQFQVYNSDIDCVTFFRITFKTTSGLLYAVESLVYRIEIKLSWNASSS